MTNVHPWWAQLMTQLPKAQDSSEVYHPCRLLWHFEGFWGKKKKDVHSHFPNSPNGATKMGTVYMLPNSKTQCGWKPSILTFPVFGSWSPNPEEWLWNSYCGTLFWWTKCPSWLIWSWFGLYLGIQPIWGWSWKGMPQEGAFRGSWLFQILRRALLSSSPDLQRNIMSREQGWR